MTIAESQIYDLSAIVDTGDVGVAATYAGGAVTLIKRRGEDRNRISGMAAVADEMTVWIFKSEVTTISRDDVVVIAGETWKVKGLLSDSAAMHEVALRKGSAPLPRSMF